MSRGPQIEGPVQDEADKLIDQGLRPYVVRDHLLKLSAGDRCEYCDETHDALRGSRVPSLRWFQLRSRKRRPKPSEELWSLIDSTPEEAAALPDVLRAAIALTEGAVATISRDHARLIAKIKAAVADMPPIVVWRFSIEYLAAAPETSHLDVSLAVARGVQRMPSGALRLDRQEIERHVALHVRDWVDRPLVFWAGSVDAARVYVEEMGRHASLIRRGTYKGHLNDDWSWYDNDGFGRLIIETRKEEEE